MLKLKRVEIHGFKSFFDRTEMRFHGSGVAAVVGPNGCGKSNLSDAISWVLGEQSAKSLRGARMEDVIFAGTRERKPLGMASVTMTLVDPGAAKLSKPAPIEPRDEESAEIQAAGTIEGVAVEVVAGDGAAATAVVGTGSAKASNGANGHAHANGHHGKSEEVTITRRLYRSGESEYLINGRSARLRDIQDLFMGTGLGPESYAIIEQGRIGQILSNKPADRRAIIEEAAGITKFKTKKRLAEAKLEGARQNLTRVFDILEEVSRQVNSLKRQAAKAKRYEELHGELTGHLRTSLAGRYQVLEQEAAKLTGDLKSAAQLHQELAQSVSQKETEQTSLQEQCYRTEAELTQARQLLADKQLDAERTRGRLELQAKQIGGIEQRLATGETETLDLDRRQMESAQQLEAHREAIAVLDQDAETARQRLAEKNAEREQLQSALRDRERAMEQARQGVLRLLGEASQLKNQLAQVESHLGAIGRDTQRLQRDEEMAQADIVRLDSAKAEMSSRLSARQLELQSLADQRRELGEDLNVRRALIAESRRTLESLRTEFSNHKARKDSLEEILSHRAYTTESVKRLFTAIEHGKISGFKPAGVLADFVEVTDPAFEKAIEEFLHEELEYVVVKDWSEADDGVALMRGDVDGRATFLVHPEAGETAFDSPSLLGDGIGARLSDVLRLTNGLTQAPAGLIPRLSRCYIATDKISAQRLAVQNPDCYFLLADGISYHGHAVSGGKKTGGGPLALKRELRELTGLVQSKQTEVDETTSTLETLERETAQMSEQLEALRSRLQAEEKDVLALDHEQRKLAEEYARAGQRLSVARLELDRLAREEERLQQQHEASLAVVAEKEQARFNEEKALEEIRSAFEGEQANAHRISEDHATLRAELAGLDERRRSERAAETRLEQQVRELGQRRAFLANELERIGVERARLLTDNVELDQRAATLAEEILGVDGSVRGLAQRESEERLLLAGLEEGLRALRADVQSAQEKRSQLEVDLVRRQADLKYLDETSRKELNAGIEEVVTAVFGSADDEAESAVVFDEAALAEAEEKYLEVRQKIENLGPVNPQALEEFQEASLRYDFLNTQRQDLLDSIRDTEKAIQEIDVESRRRFTEAFHAINEHFKEMFKTLFGGGAAEMRLTDESNAGDSGIDIVASPPGKKLQNVLLLSGGEKSLTAMSLLMAIFRYQPSPFCILDEVDAPLDEPNIIRLTRLLKEMSAQTQFIVITHAKRTMETAQALYGVTMQEPGVSKLVSVRFEPMPEQAPLELAMAGSGR